MTEIKYVGLQSLTIYDALIKAYIDGKIFVGTYAEYEIANADGKIALNALVIITDDENNSGSGGSSSGDSGSTSTSTSSLLGTGVLGYMILG